MDLSFKADVTNGTREYPPMNIHKKRKYFITGDGNDIVREYPPDAENDEVEVGIDNIERSLHDGAVELPQVEASNKSRSPVSGNAEECSPEQVCEGERPDSRAEPSERPMKKESGEQFVSSSPISNKRSLHDGTVELPQVEVSNKRRSPVSGNGEECSPERVCEGERPHSRAEPSESPMEKESEEQFVSSSPVSNKQQLQEEGSENGIEDKDSTEKLDTSNQPEEDSQEECTVAVVDGIEVLVTPEEAYYAGIFSDSEEGRESEDDEKGNEWYSCKMCDKVYFAKKTYTKHMRSCHMEQKQVCRLCNKVFARKTSMSMHMKAVHMNDRSFLCEICGQTFSWAAALTRHMASHAEIKSYNCEVCGKTFTNSWNLKSHLLIHNNLKPFACEECDKKFRTVNALKFHMRVHTNERPHVCDVCGKNFTQPSSLKTHQKMHTGERSHTCTICDEKFARNFDLKSHMRTHTKEKPFHCEECDKNFTQASSLKTHMKSHDNNKSHQCNLCGDSFALKNTLKVHMMRHRGEKPHKCPVCKKGFTQTSTLKTHMRTHDNKTSSSASHLEILNNSVHEATGKEMEDSPGKKHKCEVCGKCFALKHTLKVHLMRHKGEKPFQCSVCSKSFTQSSSLTIHMRTHTGDKPYACDVCSMQFTYSYSLQKHLWIHEEYPDKPRENAEKENNSQSVKLEAYEDEDAADNDEALEEMKMKILETIARAKTQREDHEAPEDDAVGEAPEDDAVGETLEDNANCEALEEAADDGEDGGCYYDETHREALGCEEKSPVEEKKITHSDFLSAFQSSLAASTIDD